MLPIKENLKKLDKLYVSIITKTNKPFRKKLVISINRHIVNLKFLKKIEKNEVLIQI